MRLYAFTHWQRQCTSSKTTHMLHMRLQSRSSRSIYNFNTITVIYGDVDTISISFTISPSFSNTIHALFYPFSRSFTHTHAYIRTYTLSLPMCCAHGLFNSKSKDYLYMNAPLKRERKKRHTHTNSYGHRFEFLLRYGKILETRKHAHTSKRNRKRERDEIWYTTKQKQ